MVKEVNVLFRVQKLQQGRGWVPLITTTHLIHLERRYEQAVIHKLPSYED